MSRVPMKLHPVSETTTKRTKLKKTKAIDTILSPRGYGIHTVTLSMYDTITHLINAKYHFKYNKNIIKAFNYKSDLVFFNVFDLKRERNHVTSFLSDQRGDNSQNDFVGLRLEDLPNF